MKYIGVSFVICVVLIGNSFTSKAAPEAVTMDICSLPQQPCFEKLIDLIDTSKQSVYVLSYSFESKEIMNALIVAHNRGVKVSVVVDYQKYQSKKTAKQMNKPADSGVSVFI